jgi:hypothetical protein
MANWCDFSVTVHGPLEDRKRFAAAFRSTITEVVGTTNEREQYALLNDGTWGPTDEYDHRWLEVWAVRSWPPNLAEGGPCPDPDETVLELKDRSVFRGCCKWAPPVAWLEKVANLMPALRFLCRSTTECTLYEEYSVSSAEVRRLKLALYDRETRAWVPRDPSEDIEV